MPGPPELILILVIVLVIFGAGKLPSVLGSLGKGVREFRDASENPSPEKTETTVTTVSAAPPTSVTPPVVTTTTTQEQVKQ